MKLERLKNHLQRLSDALSEFDEVLVDARMSCVPSPNALDIQCRKLLMGIDSELSDISGNVCGIGKKIEQLKSFEGIL